VLQKKGEIKRILIVCLERRPEFRCREHVQWPPKPDTTRWKVRETNREEGKGSCRLQQTIRERHRAERGSYASGKSWPGDVLHQWKTKWVCQDLEKAPGEGRKRPLQVYPERASDNQDKILPGNRTWDGSFNGGFHLESVQHVVSHGASGLSEGRPLSRQEILTFRGASLEGGPAEVIKAS